MILLWNCEVGPVIKPDKKIDDDVMPASYIVINICPIYGRFRAIYKPDSECMIKPDPSLLKATLYLTKTENRTKNSLTQLSYYYFE